MSTSTPAATSRSGARPDASPQPWWRYRMLWLVIGGPLTVVVASLITAYVAIKGQDPVLSKEEVEASSVKPGTADSLTPAVQARNHAAQAKP